MSTYTEAETSNLSDALSVLDTRLSDNDQRKVREYQRRLIRKLKSGRLTLDQMGNMTGRQLLRHVRGPITSILFGWLISAVVQQVAELALEILKQWVRDQLARTGSPARELMQILQWAGEINDLESADK